MSDTTIYLSTDRQILRQDLIEDFIASDATNFHAMHFNFDIAWRDMFRFAFFTTDVYNLNSRTIFVVPIENDVVKIPQRVLANRGDFWIGVFGFDAENDIRLTTNLLQFSKVQGAFLQDLDAEGLLIWEQVYSELMQSLDRNYITGLRQNDTAEPDRLFIGANFHNARWNVGTVDDRYLEIRHATTSASGIMTVAQVLDLADARSRIAEAEQQAAHHFADDERHLTEDFKGMLATKEDVWKLQEQIDWIMGILDGYVPPENPENPDDNILVEGEVKKGKLRLRNGKIVELSLLRRD